MEFVKMTSAVSREAESWTDATLEDVEAMDQMARGQMAPKRSLDSSAMPHSIPYTAKGDFFKSFRNCFGHFTEVVPEKNIPLVNK